MSYQSARTVLPLVSCGHTLIATASWNNRIWDSFVTAQQKHSLPFYCCCSAAAATAVCALSVFVCPPAGTDDIFSPSLSLPCLYMACAYLGEENNIFCGDIVSANDELRRRRRMTMTKRRVARFNGTFQFVFLTGNEFRHSAPGDVDETMKHGKTICLAYTTRKSAVALINRSRGLVLTPILRLQLFWQDDQLLTLVRLWWLVRTS